MEHQNVNIQQAFDVPGRTLNWIHINLGIIKYSKNENHGVVTSPKESMEHKKSSEQKKNL